MLIALFRRHGGDHVKFAALLSQRGSVSLPDETDAAAGLLLAALDVDTLEAQG
jgi:hypothetical protein